MVPEIKTWEVEEAIRTTSPDKAPGEDKIPSRILYEAIQELKEPLTRLFNHCLITGYCPAYFRRLITVALRKLKKGDFKDPKMYRPIALLNIVGKVMDKVLAKQMLFMVDAYGLLPRTYTGGRAAAGCKHAVHLLLEKIHAAWQIEEEDVVSLLMLNISGAFNNISH